MQPGLLRRTEYTPRLLAKMFGMAIFSRDLISNYDEPEARTWHEGYALCKQAEFELPSIVSRDSLNKIIDLVRSASKDGLVTNIFIGLYLHVRQLFVLTGQDNAMYIYRCTQATSICGFSISCRPNKHLCGQTAGQWYCIS